MAKVVATEEPETAAKIMQVSTQVAESPPCTPPTNDLANSTSRCEMPPASIRLPARMKKGMAASGNLLMELKISFTATSIFASATTMPTTLASPMDTAMDTEKIGSASCRERGSQYVLLSWDADSRKKKK